MGAGEQRGGGSTGSSSGSRRRGTRTWQGSRSSGIEWACLLSQGARRPGADRGDTIGWVRRAEKEMLITGPMRPAGQPTADVIRLLSAAWARWRRPVHAHSPRGGCHRDALGGRLPPPPPFPPHHTPSHHHHLDAATTCVYLFSHFWGSSPLLRQCQPRRSRSAAGYTSTSSPERAPLKGTREQNRGRAGAGRDEREMEADIPGFDTRVHLPIMLLPASGPNSPSFLMRVR